jgi:PAS domain S-box-containing protein
VEGQRPAEIFRLKAEVTGIPVKTVEPRTDAYVYTAADPMTPKPDDDRHSSPTGSVIDLTRLAALVDHAHDAVFVRNLEGQILYWNKGAERAYGWTSEEAEGQIAHMLLKTGFPKPLVVIEESLRERGEWEGRLVHADRHGRSMTVESRWALDMSGGVATILEINRDITPRLETPEALRTRERQLRFITDNAPVAIAHCDTNGRFKFVNKPYASRFGLHPSDLTGRPIAEVLGERAYETIKPYIDAVLAGEHVEVEIQVPYEKIGPQFMRFAYEPELDDAGRVVGYVAAIINVSDRRQAEEALREADRRKDAFLATLAHELRNPLAAMRNVVQLLTLPAVDKEVTERATGIIARQLKQLVRLVDDLLDVSRITRGQLQLRMGRVKLADVITTAVESTALATASASQSMIVSLPDEPVFLDADAERLSQVFSNLLANATKYTPEGGRIVVAAETAGDQVAVSISDTGVGIPPDMVESVFGMFTQVEQSRDQAYGGLGIGLTLVRFLVELHGGTVTAHSEGIDRGSTFTVCLPRVVTPSDGTKDSPRVKRPEGVVAKRILVVDDNVDTAESLQLWLEMAGHEVTFATDGPRALAMIESTHPDVVLLDLGMPGMTGFEVARRIRAASWGGKIVLVALTGWGQEEDRRQTREAGFDYHLTKPVPPNDIDELIRKL